MHLTRVLCKYRPEWIGNIPKFPGKVDIGKKRYVPAVTPIHKLHKLGELLEEEITMQALRKPFINVEQERALLHCQGRVVPAYFDDYMFKDVQKPPRQKYATKFIEGLDQKRQFEEVN